MSRPAPELKLSHEGGCSFCGIPRPETRVFVGSSITDVRICDRCLGMCCTVLAEEAKLLHKAPKDFSGADLQLGRLPEVSAAAFPDELLAEINNVLATQGPRTTPAASVEFRCSFCDAKREEVPVLVSGPRVFICSECVTRSVGMIKQQRA